MEILRKLFHFLNGDDLYNKYNLVKRTQYLPEKELKLIQEDYLQKLLVHSYENVPYYKTLFKEKGLDPYSNNFLGHFRNLPIHTKSTIRENFDTLKATNLPENRFMKNSTSGSTGESLWFYSDKEPRIRQALQMRCYDWMGYNTSKKHLLIWGSYFDTERAKKSKVKALKSFFKKTRLLSAFNISEKDLENYHEQIWEFKPYLLTSYPSILYRFATYLRDNHKDIYLPNAIQATSEKLYPFQREAIEEVFQTKIFNFYGSRDIPMIAMECEEHNGLHIMSENVFLEVLDENGNFIDDGEGDLVLTDLHNYIFPFIRYKIGDRAIISQRKCSCGRTLPLLEEVTGREFDIIRFPNGEEVGGTFWTLILRSKEGLKEFQVEQIEFNKILIRYVPDNSFDKRILLHFKNTIREYSGNNLIIDFIKVNNIKSAGKGGKFKFVIAKK